jgi:hypothetical protein
LFAAVFEPGFELGGFLPQFIIGELLQACLDLVNLMNERPEFSHFAVVLRPEYPFQKIHGKPKSSVENRTDTLRDETRSVKANRRPGGVRGAIWRSRRSVRCPNSQCGLNYCCSKIR